MQQHSDHCNSSWCFAVSAGIVPKVQLPLCPTAQHPGEKPSGIRQERERSTAVEVTWLVSHTGVRGWGQNSWSPDLETKVLLWNTITFNFSLDKYIIYHFCNVKNGRKTMGCKASMGKLLPFLLLHAWGMGVVISCWSICAPLYRVSF